MSKKVFKLFFSNCMFFLTAVSAPDHLEVDQVTPTSVKLTWSFPQGMEQITHSYLIFYNSGETQSVTSADCSTIIKGLKPYTDYNVSVRTKVNDKEMSAAVEVKVRTGESYDNSALSKKTFRTGESTLKKGCLSLGSRLGETHFENIL